MKIRIYFVWRWLLLLGFNFLQAQTPRLNSYPAAAATIYLNFDGEYVSGTPWNWNGPINAQPAGLSAEAVIEIFNRVAEDYRPFAINITTDSAVYAAAPYNRRTHLVITPTSGWYGSAGGVSYIGSFTWGDDTPAWVFSALLYNNPKNVAEACSHEAGHTLGLQHQSAYDNCVKTSEYNPGQGTGEIGWAPIMGVGYSKNMTTWHTGPNTTGCDLIQNDMDLIAGATNNIGYRPDDHADNITGAESIALQGESFQVNGMINRMTDADVFKLSLLRNSRLRVNAVPQNVGSGNQGANIDIKILLLNAASDTLGSYNPTALLDAGVDTSLQAGDYYLAVRGTGNINHSEYGSLGSYFLAGSLVTILPVQQFVLRGQEAAGHHTLTWSFRSDEAIRTLGIERSDDAGRFQLLTTVDASTTTFSCEPAAGYYRLKATGIQGVYYSNTIYLTGSERVEEISLQSTAVKSSIVFTSKSSWDYEVVDGQGRLICKGNAREGTNQVAIHQAPAGMLFIRFTNGRQNQVRKLIKQ
ncbi:MAG: T9SS type A sorting domain-containing protein [Williamsia sp.]|nr:T9SS type A sorting domain-containing protein [Williamsia sp.]